MTENQQIFNAIVEFFEDDEWDFNWMEGMPVLRMGFSGKNGKWTCYAQAREEQQQFVFYSVCPINAPENLRTKIAEFITRANYGMIIGNFEMDYDDGEVRYKTSIDVEGADLTSALTRQIVYANVIIMDRYLPGIMRCIYSDALPQECVEEIEGARHDDNSFLDEPPTSDVIENAIAELDLDALDDDFDDDDLDDDELDDDDDMLDTDEADPDDDDDDVNPDDLEPS